MQINAVSTINNFKFKINNKKSNQTPLNKINLKTLNHDTISFSANNQKTVKDTINHCTDTKKAYLKARKDLENLYRQDYKNTLLETFERYDSQKEEVVQTLNLIQKLFNPKTRVQLSNTKYGITNKSGEIEAVYKKLQGGGFKITDTKDGHIIAKRDEFDYNIKCFDKDGNLIIGCFADPYAINLVYTKIYDKQTGEPITSTSLKKSGKTFDTIYYPETEKPMLFTKVHLEDGKSNDTDVQVISLEGKEVTDKESENLAKSLLTDKIIERDKQRVLLDLHNFTTTLADILHETEPSIDMQEYFGLYPTQK